MASELLDFVVGKKLPKWLLTFTEGSKLLTFALTEELTKVRGVITAFQWENIQSEVVRCPTLTHMGKHALLLLLVFMRHHPIDVQMTSFDGFDDT